MESQRVRSSCSRSSRSLTCCLIVLAMCCRITGATAEVSGRTSAQFVFGDSLVDAGNNDFFTTLARADFPSNGIDFPGGKPTGRFCNGRTVPDVIGQLLGLPFAPAFMDPNTKGTNILKGVNYGSGAAGILRDSGYLAGKVIPFDDQIKNFEETKKQMVELIGPAATDELLANSLVSIVHGANDYVNNYFLPGSRSSRDYTVPQYQDLLINTLRAQLEKIYSIGARRIAVSAIGPVACTPARMILGASRNADCADASENKIVLKFNAAMKDMIRNLNTKYGQPHFSYLDAYFFILQIIHGPNAHGFETANEACCGLGGAGKYNALAPCLPGVPVCPDRTKSFFWDAFHPTDRANEIIAKNFLDGDGGYPMNLRALVNYEFS